MLPLIYFCMYELYESERKNLVEDLFFIDRPQYKQITVAANPCADHRCFHLQLLLQTLPNPANSSSELHTAAKKNQKIFLYKCFKIKLISLKEVFDKFWIRSQ